MASNAPVRSSYKSSYGIFDSGNGSTMRGTSSTKYTTPSDPVLRGKLSWARQNNIELYREYINADSAMFHGIDKQGGVAAKALKRMSATLDAIDAAMAASGSQLQL